MGKIIKAFDFYSQPATLFNMDFKMNTDLKSKHVIRHQKKISFKILKK